MDKIKNYKTLDLFLYENGLTYKDIDKEFRQIRQPLHNSPHYCFAKDCVVPTLSRIPASRITNGSYGVHGPHSLMQWFEYDFRNNVIMENLGRDNIRELQQDNNVEFLYTNDNQIYLENDGNHRLFNYLLTHLVESKSCKTTQELMNCDKRFQLVKPIHYEHRNDLIEEFRRYGMENTIGLPPMIKEYMAKTSKTGSDISGDYMTYNPSTQKYNITLNGITKYDFDENQAVEHIRRFPMLPEGFAVWKNEPYYYMAMYNEVYKTKDPNKLQSIVTSSVNNSECRVHPPYEEEYMAEHDMDNNTTNITIKEKLYLAENYKPGALQRIAKEYRQAINENQDYFLDYLDRNEYHSFITECGSKSNIIYRVPPRHYYNIPGNTYYLYELSILNEMFMRKRLDKKEANNQSSSSL